MHRIDTRTGWVVALTIVALTIAAPHLAYSLAATATLHENGSKVEIHPAGKRLVFEVKGSSTEFEAYPDGTFVHASSGFSLTFDDGEPLRYDGIDGAAEIERMAVRDGQLLIYLDNGDRGLISPKTLEDGLWTNRRAGTDFLVEDGRIIECDGFKPKS